MLFTSGFSYRLRDVVCETGFMLATDIFCATGFMTECGLTHRSDPSAFRLRDDAEGGLKRSGFTGKRGAQRIEKQRHALRLVAVVRKIEIQPA